MLRRPLDRIELKHEDKKELEERRKETPSLDVKEKKDRSSTENKTHANPRQPTTTSVTQEVEVKLKLIAQEDHAKAKAILSPYHHITHDQENFFFDGAEQELSSEMHIMRIRFYNQTEKAVLTVKARASLADGIGRAVEEEEEVNVAEARKCIERPELLLQLQSSLVQKVKEKFDVDSMVGFGGFKNIRDVYLWEGYTLELDKTIYDFGTNFEIECETDEPVVLRNRLEKLFSDNGIRYKYKTMTKFTCFLERRLDDDP